jgi:ABC-type multidrug transport system ATPase subunit
VGALIAPAGLLLLDEPTAGLDSRRRAALGSLVERRASAGPVVVASQDLEWVEGLRGVRVELGG